MPVMPTDNQVERVLGGVRGHVGSIRDVTRLDRESSNRVSPVREPVALDRSKRPPRSVARQAPFWERPSLALPDPWEPRCGFAN